MYNLTIDIFHISHIWVMLFVIYVLNIFQQLFNVAIIPVSVLNGHFNIWINFLYLGSKYEMWCSFKLDWNLTPVSLSVYKNMLVNWGLVTLSYSQHGPYRGHLKWLGCLLTLSPIEEVHNPMKKPGECPDHIHK